MAYFRSEDGLLYERLWAADGGRLFDCLPSGGFVACDGGGGEAPAEFKHPLEVGLELVGGEWCQKLVVGI